jgi:dATP pyrophosphohydrolase
MAGIPVQCTMVAVVVLRGAGVATQVLLLRRARAHLHGLWAYIAGHIEPGEKAWQAAVRELHEEAGLQPLMLYSADRCESYYDVGAECIAVVPAFVAFVDAAAAVRLNAEHDAHRWLSFDEALPRLAFGGQRELFAHVRREFVERPPSEALRMPLANR